MEGLFYISQNEFDSYKEEQLNKLKDLELLVDKMCTEYIQKKENILTRNRELASKKLNLKSLLEEDLLIIKNNNKQLFEECEVLEKKNEQLNRDLQLKLENLIQLQSEQNERDKQIQFLKNNMKTLMKVNIKNLKLYEILGLEIEPIEYNKIKIHFHEIKTPNSFISLTLNDGNWRFTDTNLSHYNNFNELTQKFEQTQDLLGLLCYFHSFFHKNSK